MWTEYPESHQLMSLTLKMRLLFYFQTHNPSFPSTSCAPGVWETGPCVPAALRNNNQHRQQRQPQLLLPCESELWPLHGKDIFLLERGRLWELSCSEMSSAVPQHSPSITGKWMQFKIPRNKTFPNLTSHNAHIPLHISTSSLHWSIKTKYD